MGILRPDHFKDPEGSESKLNCLTQSGAQTYRSRKSTSSVHWCDQGFSVKLVLTMDT